MKELIVLAKDEAEGEAMMNLARLAAEGLEIQFTLSLVTDKTEVMMHGVTLTPALVIDDAVRIMGRVPDLAEMEHIIDMVQ